MNNLLQNFITERPVTIVVKSNLSHLFFLEYQVKSLAWN